MSWAASPSCPIPMGLKQVHEAYIAACENVSDTPAGEDNGALVEVAVKYWCGNRNIHAFIWNQYRELVSDSLIEDILDENPTDAAELKRLTEALATRSRVYGEYNKEYNRKYRPSRL